jgi:phosphatidylglycerophosphate synthase
LAVSERPVTAPAVDGPTLGLAVQFALFAVLAVGVGLGRIGWLAGTAYAVITWAALTRARNRTGMRALGPANTVTLARATLVGAVAALVADSLAGPVPVAALVGFAVPALILDGVDGQVARRTGTTSALGARFDMEVDSFLVLVLSVYVAQSFGWWVLAIGLFRYAFGAAAWVAPWLNRPLPPRLTRKTVAAVQGIVLVVASADVLPRWLTVPAVAAALALLCWSFGRDIAWLWRTHQRTQTAVPG